MPINDSDGEWAEDDYDSDNSVIVLNAWTADESGKASVRSNRRTPKRSRKTCSECHKTNATQWHEIDRYTYMCHGCHLSQGEQARRALRTSKKDKKKVEKKRKIVNVSTAANTDRKPVGKKEKKKSKTAHAGRLVKSLPKWEYGHFSGTAFDLLGFSHKDTDEKIDNWLLRHNDTVRKLIKSQKVSDITKYKMYLDLKSAYEIMENREYRKRERDNMDALGRRLPLGDRNKVDIGDEPTMADYENDVDDGVADKLFGVKVLKYETHLERMNDVIEAYRFIIKQHEKQKKKLKAKIWKLENVEGGSDMEPSLAK